MKNKVYFLLKAIEIIMTFLISVICLVFILFKTKLLLDCLVIFLSFFLILICVIDTKFGLLLALCIMYNPYYAFISNTQIWNNASIRVFISVYFMVVLFFSILVTMKIDKLTIGSFERRLFLFLLMLIIGTCYGIFCGNNMNDILADLFPFLEFIGYYLLTFIILKNSTEMEIKRLLKYLLVWCLSVVFSELLTYVIFNQQFAYQIYISDFKLKRIMDFMLIFILTSLLVAIKFNLWRSFKIRIFFQIGFLICIIAIFLSFTRSIWLGVLINSLFVIYSLEKRKYIKYTKLFKISIVIIFTLIINYAFGLHLLELIVKLSISRIVEHSLYSPLGVSFDFFRIMHLKSQLREIITHPLLGKGMGGTFWALYGDIGPLKEGWTSQVFNIYIRIIFKLGSIGFLIFFMLISDIWRRANRCFYITRTVMGRMISYTIKGTMIGYGITFLFFTPILHFPIMAYFGFLLGILRIFSKY